MIYKTKDETFRIISSAQGRTVRVSDGKFRGPTVEFSKFQDALHVEVGSGQHLFLTKHATVALLAFLNDEFGHKSYNDADWIDDVPDPDGFDWKAPRR